jgi:carbonic anhydrase
MDENPAEAVLKRLMEGNRRFAEGRAGRSRNDPLRRDELVGGQKPVAAILGCADSRVPPELVFDQGLGDLFVVRGAGHVADGTNLGSLEFAVANLGVPLIVVLGHEGCGAVQAAVAFADAGEAPDGHLAAVVEAIEPVPGASGVSREARVDATIREHVRQTAERVRNAAPVLSERAKAGQLRVVAAIYRLGDGRVELID